MAPGPKTVNHARGFRDNNAEGGGLTVAEVSLVDMSFAPGLPTTLHSLYSFIVFVAMLSLHRFHTARPATALFNAGISSFANSSMLRSQLSLSSQS